MDIIYRDAMDILLLQWEWLVSLSEPTGFSLPKVLLFWGVIVFFSFYAVFGIRSGTTIYFEVALIIAVLGFGSSVALAKFLMRGEVIE